MKILVIFLFVYTAALGLIAYCAKKERKNKKMNKVD